MPEKVEQKADSKGSKDRGPPPKAPVRVLNEFKELDELTKALPTFIKLKNRKNASENTLMTWTGLLCPENAPYKRGAWKIEFQLSPSYPQEPPKLRFLTPMYHPNVDMDTGDVGLELLDKSVWRESMTISEVIENLLKLIESPNANSSEFVRNSEAAKQYKRKVEEFNRKAAEYADNSAHRPPDCSYKKMKEDSKQSKK